METVIKKSYKSSVSKKCRLDTQISTDLEVKKKFSCDICGYSSSYKSHMNVHVASVHEVKKPFKCYICEVSFSLKVVHECTC